MATKRKTAKRAPAKRKAAKKPTPRKKSTSKALAVAKPTVPTEAMPATAASAMAVITRLAADKTFDVARMERLFDLVERFKKQEAKEAYINARIDMKPHLPIIEQHGKIEIRKKDAHGKRTGPVIQSTKYAYWEDIDDAITPVLDRFGFFLDFRPGTAADGKSVTVTAILSHRGGHTEEATTPPMPADLSGSKNPVQSIGSTISYGKRYAAGLILNLRFSGEDDDGQAGGDGQQHQSVTNVRSRKRGAPEVIDGSAKELPPNVQDEKKRSAIEWGTQAIKWVDDVGDPDEYEKWRDHPQNVERMTRLEAYDAKLHGELKAAMDKASREFGISS